MSLEFNLIADYIPDTVSDESVRGAYSRLQAWFAVKFPDVDTRPGSVFGDCYVLPAATWLAAVERGMAGFSDDLDLETVASGVIGRCDFVSMYLKNFGAYDNQDLKSVGIIRLVFATDGERSINKSITFSYNDNLYQLRLFGNEDFRILPVGSARVTPNDYVLAQTSLTRFYVDLPVEGYSQGSVPENTRFVSSLPIDGNTDIYAVGDFLISSYTSSIPQLAKKTRETFYAASMGSKSGVVRTLKREFPDLLSVSPVIQGDQEMTRDCSNAFGVSLPAADVFVKSPLYGSTAIQVIKVPYVDGMFFAKVEFVHVPLNVRSITLAGSTSALPFELFTRSKNEVLYPRLSCAYSLNADYWVKIVPENQIPTAIDEDGNPYQNFEITYECEPYAGIVGRWMEATENSPIGLNIQVRAAIPYVLDGFDVNFKRDRGKRFDNTSAVSEIYSYMRSIAYPAGYTDAEIVDTMFYAGASSTKSIIPSGNLKFSPANYYVDTISDEPLDIVEETMDIPTIGLGSTTQFTTSYVDESASDTNLFYSTSELNTGFLLAESGISLNEL